MLPCIQKVADKQIVCHVCCYNKLHYSAKYTGDRHRTVLSRLRRWSLLVNWSNNCLLPRQCRENHGVLICSFDMSYIHALQYILQLHKLHSVQLIEFTICPAGIFTKQTRLSIRRASTVKQCSPATRTRN